MNFEATIFDNKRRHHRVATSSNAVSATLSAFRQTVEHYLPDNDFGKQMLSALSTNHVYAMFRIFEVSDTYLNDPRPLKDEDIREIMILAIWDPRASALPMDPNAMETPFWFDPDGTICPIGYIRPLL